MTEDRPVGDQLNDLRRRAEEKARANESLARDMPLPDATQRLLHELRVHQIELEMQNEELCRAQAELESSRARYFDLFDLAPVGYFTVSEKGLILEANLTATHLLGVTRRDLLRQPLSRFVLPEDQDIFYRHRIQIFAGGAPQRCELRMLGAGGAFWVRMEATPMPAGDGGAALCRCVVSDISDRKRVEEDLRQAREAADAANQAKSAFLANMSHEIRTPMTAILGFTDLMLNAGCTVPEQREYLEIVQENGRVLLQLINDILDLSKIEADKLSADRQGCSLWELVEQVVSLMQVRVKEKHLTLHVDFQYPLPETIRTDPVRLRQILVNLLGNAVKFTEHGSVRITVSCTGPDGPSPKIHFAVTDTGIGISPEGQRQLFEPFNQVLLPSNRRYGGTGLGLAISKRLAEMLGGGISVCSQVDHGSTFTVSIDPGPLDGVAMRGARPAPLAPPDAEHAPAVGLRGRVLLAEDADANQRLIRQVLENASLRVDLAENGLLACSMAQASLATGIPYDLILMDIQMPELNGYDATARLRSLGWRGPIVALTAQAMVEDRAKCLAAGCDDYISKPVTRHEMLSKIAPYLEPTGG